MGINKVINKRSPHFGDWRVRVQPMVRGQTISIPVQYAKTKSAAKRLEAILIDQAKSGYDFSVANGDLPEMFSEWINKEIKMDRWSPASIKTWRYTEKIVHYYLKGVTVKSVNEDVIREFIHNYVKDHHASVAPHSTASKLLTQLRTYFLTLEGTVIKKSPVPKRSLDYFFRRDR